MTWAAICFWAGLIVGTFLGVLIMALLAMAARSGEPPERLRKAFYDEEDAA
jgi:uncharacterized membrane-anchored protein YhcB (DUF1043 family)